MRYKLLNRSRLRVSKLALGNRYTEGTSEKFLGESIASDREHFVVATKYTLFTRRDDPNFSGNHRKNMVQALEGSLKRLGTDYIDLYWLHAWDFTTAPDEVMRALDDDRIDNHRRDASGEPR